MTRRFISTFRRAVPWREIPEFSDGFRGSSLQIRPHIRSPHIRAGSAAKLRMRQFQT
jgi:hypothetical protein